MYLPQPDHRSDKPAAARRGLRRGLSLAELLIASVVLTMVVGSLAAVSATVHDGLDVSSEKQELTQHGRVALQRIERRLAQAWSSSAFPGFIGVRELFAGVEFPEAVAVWSPPTSGPSDPDGLPLVSELVVFCPHPTLPNQLLEITHPTDSTSVPPISDTSAWRVLIDDFQTNSNAVRITLTDRIRTASISDGIDTSTRACVRFDVVRRPSDSDLGGYQSGTVFWEDLVWPLDMYSSNVGTQQSWCQIELQVSPAGSNDRQESLPFFGSATCYSMVKPN